MDERMKECRECGRDLPESNFGKRLGGLEVDCKQCKNRKAREYRAKDPDKWRSYKRKYRAAGGGAREKALIKARKMSDPEYREREKEKERIRRMSPEAKARRTSKQREAQKLRGSAFHIKKSYGITIEDRDDMIIAQGGKCKNCSRPLCFGSGRDGAAHNVDHCHEGEFVRGILCWDCNAGIGKLGDKFSPVYEASYYLTEFELDLVGMVIGKKSNLDRLVA